MEKRSTPEILCTLLFWLFWIFMVCWYANEMLICARSIAESLKTIAESLKTIAEKL